jgi:hypothetical protein
LIADGFGPTCVTAGAGAGGTIYLKSGTIVDGTPAGLLRANGGSVAVGASNGGGGGGGIIYIQSLTSNTFTGTIQAAGGSAQTGREGLSGFVTIAP